MRIDLLPTEYRFRVQLSGALRKWTRVWSILLVVLAMICSIPLTRLLKAQHEQRLISSRCSPLLELHETITRNQSLKSRLAAEKRQLGQFKPSPYSLDLLQVFVDAAKPVSQQLQFQKMGLTINRSKASNPAKRGPNDANKQTASSSDSAITIDGIAEGESTLSFFVDNLRQANVFERVDLKSTSQIQSGDLLRQQYQLECRMGALP